MQRITTALIVGIFALVAGGYVVQRGNDARSEIRSGLAREHVTVAKDAKHHAGKAVNSAATAEAEADAIWEHTMKATGGKTYAEMKKDDPARSTAKDGAALRTGLMLSVLAFGVTDLVVGLGWAIFAFGLGAIALAGVWLIRR